MAGYILIVDDDPAILEGVAMLLEQAGYDTHCVSTGADALHYLEGTTPPTLVILDIMLPGIDGYTVCRHLRLVTPYIPILMLSARDEVNDKVIGLDLGADEYVTKPFEPRELLARVRAMLRFAEQRRAAQSQENLPLICGPIKLWKAQYRVEIHDRAVCLTPTEWALLEFLIEHPGQVFGRETLLRHVWGDTFLGDSRTVDVHIQRLRAKLEPDGATPRYIQTVRGFGYRFLSGEEGNGK